MESRLAMVARMFHEGASSEREGGSGAGARGRGRSSRDRARSGGGVRDRRKVQQAGDRDRERMGLRRRRRRRPGPGVGGLRTGVGPRQGRRAVGRRDRSHQRRRRVRGRRPRARARALRGRRAATGGRLRRGGGVDEGLRRGQVVRAAEARRQLRAVVPDAPVERALERPEPLEGRGLRRGGAAVAPARERVPAREFLRDAHGTAVQDRREEDAERRVVGHVREAPLAEPQDDLGHVLALFRAPRADALPVVRPRAPRPRLRFLHRRRGGRNLLSCQQGRGCRWRSR
mmetsp:Transcript_23209/g.69388  ORF Transcript_23209/g.69388 Transcript_23209/m.69388 type:complete len:287 (-) Transcript_23209:329-1189(-)